MTPRRVILTLEIETARPIGELKRRGDLSLFVGSSNVGEVIVQVQANVVRRGKGR